MPPIAEPTRIPTRAASMSLEARIRPRLLRRGDGEQDVPVHATRLLRRRRARRGRSPVTSAAIRTGYSEASNASMNPTPLRPRRPRPSWTARRARAGVTAPRPVIATLRMGESLTARCRLALPACLVRAAGAASRSSGPPTSTPSIPFPPMEAELVRELPTGDEWQYEPKWDGFRGLLENAPASSASGRATRDRSCATSPSCARSASCCRHARRSTARS